MIGYVLFGTNQFDKAVAFYETLMSSIGAQRVSDGERMVMWSYGDTGAVGVCKPADGEPATQGNGTMIAIPLPDQAAVDAVYATAMEAGAESCSEPTSVMPGFYAAYFRDLDRNKFCFYYMQLDS